MDYKLAATAYFDTFEVAAEAAVVQSLALESGINFFYPTEGSVRMSFDEVTTPEEIAEVIRIFAAAKGKKAKAVKPVTESNVPAGLRRSSAYLTEPVFNAYRSEMLFFHRGLRSLVAIELKLGAFKAEYVGKMNLYLSLLDRLEKGENENPSIGIILCADKDHLDVEIALQDINKPIGVAEYQLLLPKDELQALLIQEINSIEESGDVSEE